METGPEQRVPESTPGGDQSCLVRKESSKWCNGCSPSPAIKNFNLPPQGEPLPIHWWVQYVQYGESFMSNSGNIDNLDLWKCMLVFPGGSWW